MLNRHLLPAMAVLAILLSGPARGVEVLTQHYNNARTGLNANETRLTPRNVKTPGFGKLFSHELDGPAYAQPLYVSRLAIPGKGTHNVVYVATQSDTVYAFDADNARNANAQPLWKASLVDERHGAAPGAAPVPLDAFGVDEQGQSRCGNIWPTVGITSTPVIDRAARVLYVVAKSKENGQFVHRLHALDLATGAEKPGSPVDVPGRMPMSEDFDPLWHLQRAALLLANGTVYIAFGSHCDGLEVHPYRGWMFAYDAATLAPKTVLPLTRGTDSAASIWMSGAGPAADAQGQVYAVTGDGQFDGQRSFGDSILRMDGSTLTVKDLYTPADNATLDLQDADLGSGGVLLLPDQPGAHPHLLAQGSKDGRIHLLDRDQLGGAGARPLQTFPKGTLGAALPPGQQQDWIGLFGLPSYWMQKLYFWGTNDVLKVFSLRDGLLDTQPQQGTTTYGYPGANLSISASGKRDGIVWSIQNSSSAAVLHAWDATTLQKLYGSDQAADDAMGPSTKFNTPTVANGKVFVAGGARLTVYGRRFKLFGTWYPLY